MKLLSPAFVLLGIGLAAALCAPAQAQNAPAPDIGAGKRRAAVCFACHNENGIASIPGTPSLAHQDRTYLANAIREFRDGRRNNTTMSPMVKPLSDADIANIAAYFSSLPK
jgi:cytochrome c553